MRFSVGSKKNQTESSLRLTHRGSCLLPSVPPEEPSENLLLSLEEIDEHLLQRLRLLLLLVATFGSSYFVPLPPSLPPLHLLRRRLGSRDQTGYFRFCKSPTKEGNAAPHLSPAARFRSHGFERTVRAGAGPIGTQVDAEPAGQPLVLDGLP